MDLNNAKEKYNEWLLRIFIILSIIAQFLVFFSSFLGRKGNLLGSMRRIIWVLIFLGADSIATSSLSNIFQSSMSPSKCEGTKETQANDPQFNNLFALWATSVLLHLGGHSTISSFSLDNDSWWILLLLRYILHLSTTAAICILSFLQGGVSLSVLILLIVGILKIFECLALSRGSIRRLISSASVNSNNDQMHPRSLTDENSQLPSYSRVDPLLEAYSCFEKYKGIYIDRTNFYTPYQMLSGKSIDKCIELLEMELDFAYEMCYSKSIIMLHTHCGWIIRVIIAIMIRVIIIIMIVSAYVLFTEREKPKLPGFDRSVTSVLLIKSVVLEFLSFLLSLMSSHTLVRTKKLKGRFWRVLETVIVSCQSFKDRIFPPSIKVGQFNLVTYCFRDCKPLERLREFLENIELKEFVDNCYNVSHIPLDEDSEKSIFSRVKSRSGDRQKIDNISKDRNPELYESLRKSFEERLLIYHIATDLCSKSSKDSSEHLKMAKPLSEYMLNLLVVHHSLLSPLLTVELRNYSDTCSAAMEFLGNFPTEDLDKRYTRLMDQKDDVKDLEDRNRFTGSMLSLGICVARELLDLDFEGDKWELLFQLWVDLLCFAASQSKGKNHAKELANGKELLTIIWLYMIHLGMTNEDVPQTEADQSSVRSSKIILPRKIQQDENNITEQAQQVENNTSESGEQIQEVENNITQQA